MIEPHSKIQKSNNGKTSRYTYNASGERIIKSYGTMEGVYINGAPQGITFHETDNFTLYPAPIISINKNRFTKHYFIGSQRIASRIGTGTFNNVYGINGSYITAGQQDYAERMNQIESQKEAYYKELGIAPGVPTEKGAYGDPENTGVGYNTIITNLGDHSVPDGWVQTPKHNTTDGSTPGTPISWNDPSNPDDPQAGYGYIANDTTAEETFFFHSDHLGSTSYITDDKGNITQYDAYLPYGELLVDEHSSSEEMPYKFNGKEFDEETGLYYYGARYMQPMASIWYGVDPLTEKYTNVSGYTYCLGNPIKLVDPDGREGDNPSVLYTNTSGAKGIIENGFNANKYGKYSNYNWFSTRPNAVGTGRTNTGVTLGVKNIDVSDAHVITKAQTTAWRLEAMKELGYTKEGLKSLQATDSKAYGQAMSKINGAMYSKVGSYMDNMGYNSYFLAKDGTYAVSDAVANKGVISSIQGNANYIKALNGLKVAGRILMAVGVALDTYDIYSSSYNPRTVTGVVGGWSGAWAGAKVGGTIGTSIGLYFGGVGEIVSGPAAAVIGGIIGYFWR